LGAFVSIVAMTARSAPTSAQFFTYHERQKLAAPDASQGDYFGDAIAINENRILIGSPLSGAGAAYVFRREDGGTPSDQGDDQWNFEQMLTAWDGAVYDEFGRSVAIGSDVAFVGASEADGQGFGSGSVYVFRLDTNGTPADLTDVRWIPWQKLTAWDGAAGDKFGSSAALDGDRAVVGASWDDGSEVDAGSAYVYRRQDNGTPQTPDDDYWLLEAKLIPSGGGTIHHFGRAVSISSIWIVVGTPFWGGAAYVFRHEDNGTPSNPADDLWVEESTLVASDAAGGFGWAVDINGSTAIVGAPQAGIDMCTDTRGPCFNDDECSIGVCDPRGNICHRDSDCLPHADACVQPPDYGPCDGGCSMYSFNTCTGECEIFGYGCCDGNENNFETLTECQAACLSAQTACLLPSDPGIGGDQLQRYFYEPCGNSCELFVYGGSGGNANNFLTLADCQNACPPSNPPSPVCAGGATCGVLTGAAYVFQYNGNSWVQQAKIYPHYGNDSGYFGAAVSIHGDRTAIGAYWGDVSLAAPGAVSESGIAFLFERASPTAEDWDQKAALSPSDAEWFQHFGKSVAIQGEWIAIGSPLDNSPAFRAGSAYIFNYGPLHPDPNCIDKTRFISFSVPGGASQMGLRVNLVSLHHVIPPYTGGPSVPFTSFEGQVRWVGPPAQYMESTSNLTPFYAASLQCAPHYQDWSTVGLLHVAGSAIVPSSIYEVQSVAASCMGSEASCTAVSVPLRIATTRWGDVETPYNPPNPTAQPDVGDIAALVKKFQSGSGAPIKARSLLAGDDAFGNITTLGVDLNFGHIAACVDAFRGKPYPYTMQGCP
jgi:hypothetical protein